MNTLIFKKVKIRKHEIGLHFHDGEFTGLLDAGCRWFFDPLGKVNVEVVSRRAPWLCHKELDAIVRSGKLDVQAEVVDLKDHQRALVWIDGRFDQVLGPGLYAYWKGHKEVRVEQVDIADTRFEHKDLGVIVRNASAIARLDICRVEKNRVGVLFYDGRYVGTLQSGLYAFWKGAVDARLIEIDMREAMVELGGQEIMTADKVTLRLNATVTYRVVDAQRAVTTVDDHRQAIYREAQLALRAAIGTRMLDDFLADKDALGEQLEHMLRDRAEELGIEIVSIGIRDVILPGEMKELMNRVTEAKKAAEANLIARREETAAMRSQANTAKLLENSSTLMRLRELEVLEKIASNSKLNVVLGEKGLAERVVNLL